MSVDLYAIRGRIARAQQEVARGEGEAATLAAEADANLVKLRQLLGCKAGKEREAIAALRASIEGGTAEVDALLAQAEAARDQRPG